MAPPIKYFLAEDTITAQEQDGLADWLRTHPRMTQGPITTQFQDKWSGWVDRKYSVACNSGSSANLLAAAALYYSRQLRNRRVIVPSVGWVTTISPFFQLGFDSVMCEADKDSFGLDLNHLETLIKKYNPGTVIYVQVLGVPHHVEEMLALKDKYGFALIEDSCAAMGSSYKGRKVGTFGDMSTVSTYFGHQFSTIEGGIVSTDDAELRDLLVMLRSHGWIKDLEPQSQKKWYEKYDVDPFHAPFFFAYPGFNVRITDLQSYIGLGQLDKMDWLVGRRFENHSMYKNLLDPYLYSQQYDEKNTVVCSIHYGALASSQKERTAIVQALVANGIETRMFAAGNLGRHPFWTSRYDVFKAPMADRIHYSGFFLPNHPSLKPEDIEFIAGVVKDAVLKYREGELK